MQPLNDWLQDLPHEFREKDLIKLLIRVYQKQLDELYVAFTGIVEDTTLVTSTGKNLDGIGDIVCLTRKQGFNLISSSDVTELGDEMYRSTLQYKILQNTCDCTYNDIMESIALLWDTDDITYIEDVKKPATVQLKLPTVKVDMEDPAAGKVLSIKSSGVTCYYTVDYQTEVLDDRSEHAQIPHVTFLMGMCEYNSRRFDGSGNFDGSIMFNSVDNELPVSMKIGAFSIKTEEQISEVHYISRKDLNYFDGSQKFNGNVFFDATIEEEDL